MEKINLHMHSNYSLDGNFDINRIINESFSNGISYLSITDHDNCNAYFDLDTTKIKQSGTLIYGIEADAIINNITYDILCYGFDLNKIHLWSKTQYGTIVSRQLKIYNKLKDLCKNLDMKLNTSIPYNPEKEFAHAAIFRMLESYPYNKEFLHKYNIKNVHDLYRESTMNTRFPLFFDMSIVWPKIETLSQIVHNNGGKIFLAHPYKYAKNIEINEILNSCLPYIDGIEICNEPKNAEEVKFLYNFAKKNNLLISAGSDYHGSENHNTLNVNYLTAEMENDIKDWISNISGKIQIN